MPAPDSDDPRDALRAGKAAEAYRHRAALPTPLVPPPALDAATVLMWSNGLTEARMAELAEAHAAEATSTPSTPFSSLELDDADGTEDSCLRVQSYTPASNAEAWRVWGEVAFFETSHLDGCYLTPNDIRELVAWCLEWLLRFDPR